MRLVNKIRTKLQDIDLNHPSLKKNIFKFSLFTIFGISLILLVPNKAIDPWNLINPGLITLIVLMVVAIQFISYVVIELWKSEGLLIMGALIGLVNSNVINGTMASITKQNPRLSNHAAAAVVCGNLSMLIRNIIVVVTLSFTAAKFVVPPLLAMVISGLISIYYTLKITRQKIGDPGSESVGNPFEIKTALIYAGMITLITIAGFLIHSLLGDAGLYVTAFLSVYAAGGPIIISAVMLAIGGHITFMTAAIVVLIASFSSVTNDAILQLMCGAKALALSFIKISIPIIVAGALVVGIEILIYNNVVSFESLPYIIMGAAALTGLYVLISKIRTNRILSKNNRVLDVTIDHLSKMGDVYEGTVFDEFVLLDYNKYRKSNGEDGFLYFINNKKGWFQNLLMKSSINQIRIYLAENMSKIIKYLPKNNRELYLDKEAKGSLFDVSLMVSTGSRPLYLLLNKSDQSINEIAEVNRDGWNRVESILGDLVTKL